MLYVNYENVIGYAKVKYNARNTETGETKEKWIKTPIYGCNGLCAFVLYAKTEKELLTYFFADKTHFENCLGMHKNHEDCLKDGIKDWELNLNSKTAETMFKSLLKAKYTVKAYKG